MPQLTQAPYAGLIRNIPLLQHSVEVDATFWQPRFQQIQRTKLFGQIFGNNTSIRLSRQRLLTHQYNSRTQHCAEILLWGYPRNQRGITVRGLSNLTAVTNHANSQLPWPDYHNAFPKGFGISTTSKLAYFCGRQFGGSDALILDERVRKALARWQEVATPQIRPYTYSRVNNYVAYITNAATAAGQIGCRPDTIEFFLFAMGQSF